MAIKNLMLRVRINNPRAEDREPRAVTTLQCRPVSRRVNSSRAADDEATLIEIETTIATSDEIAAAANFLARGFA